MREIIEICVNFKPEIIEAGDLESAQSALATLKEISANLIEYYTRLLEAFDEEVVNSDEVLWNFDEIVYDVNTVLETKTKKMLRNFDAFTVLGISEKLGVVLPNVIKVWRDIVETVDKIASRNNNIKSSAKHLIKQLIELNEFIVEIKSATNPIILLSEYSTELRAILIKELKEYEKIINRSMAEAHGCLTIMSNDYTLREKVDQIRIEKSFANFMDFYSKKVGFMNKDELQLQEYKEMALNSLQKLTRHFEGYVQEITEIVIENFLHNFQSITKEILNDSDMYSNLYQSSDIKRTYFCYAIKIPAAISAQYDQYLSILTKLFNPKTCDVTQQQSIKIFEIFDKKMFELGKELITGNYSKKILNMVISLNTFKTNIKLLKFIFLDTKTDTRSNSGVG